MNSQTKRSINWIIRRIIHDFSVPFPDIDWDEMMSDEEQEEPIIFADGDNMRTEEVRLKAPLSLIGVTLTMMDDGGQEDEEAEEYEEDYEEESINFPVAVSIGLVLNNPDGLSIEGELGREICKYRLI